MSRNLYDEDIRNYLRKIVEEHGYVDSVIKTSSSIGRGVVSAKVIPPEWFKLPSDEYPIARGREYMMECVLENTRAHVFTSDPYIGEASVRDIIDLNLDSIKNRSLFYCTLNVVLRRIGLIDRTIHCRGDSPVKCAYMMMKDLWEKHGDETLLIIGYQPALVNEAVKWFRNMHVVDMDPENIGRKVGDIVVQDAVDELDLIDRSDIVLVTGSSVINSSFWSIYERSFGKKLYMYGVTGAGVAYVMGVPRLCYYGE